MGALGSIIEALGNNGLNPNNIANKITPFIRDKDNRDFTKEQQELIREFLKDQTTSNQNFSRESQDKFFENQNNLLQKQHDRTTGEFEKHGLPGFLGQTGGANALPRQVFHMGGANSFTSGPVGARMPRLQNDFQSNFGWGVPDGFGGAR